MFNEYHYVPVLKWKRGEQVALEKLNPAHKEKLTPLIEVVPVTYDYKNDRPKETIDEHLGDFCDQLKVSWGSTNPVFVDLDYLDIDDRMQDNRHPVKFIFDELRTNSLFGIPVTGSGRDRYFQDEVKRVSLTDNRGICIRLKDDDFFDVVQVLNGLLKFFEITSNMVDLIIDVGEITINGHKSAATTIVSILRTIPNIEEFRTLTVLGTSFPSNLSNYVPTGTTGAIPRYEMNIWKLLHTNRDRILRMPSFGDYNINSPDIVDMDPRLMQMAAGIRYTGDDFFIFRGVSIKKVGAGGWGQSRDLCRNIVKHPSFCGPTFSWGDEYIYDCAEGKASTGNAETWRRVGTNHHLTYVVNELSNLV